MLPPGLIRDECWRRGRLSYLLHAGQLKIDELCSTSKTQLFVGNIARQFGKSFWAVSKAIEKAIKTPKARIKYGTAFHTDLTEFILPTFDAVLEHCPVNIKPTYKIAGSKWVFKNGSEIKLVGLDKNPNGLRGNVIDLIIIDECGFVSNLDYIYRSIIVPATLHRPNCKIIFISTPPNTPAHSFIDFVQKAEVEGGYVKLTINENPLISQTDIERMAKELGGVESTAFRRECLCELISDSDSQIIPEWRDTFIKDIIPDEYYPFYHRYEGMDLGVKKDFTAVIFGYYDFARATLCVQDEIKLIGPRLTTKILAAEIKEQEQKLWGEHKVYRRISDNNNPQLIQDLAIDHNLSFIETNKEALEAMVNQVRLMVASGKIEVAPKCKFLIGCLRYGVWDSQRKKFAKSTGSAGLGHYDALAALMYLVRNLDRHVNPIPHDLHYTTNTFIHANKPELSSGAKVISTLFKKPTIKPTY